MTTTVVMITIVVMLKTIGERLAHLRTLTDLSAREVDRLAGLGEGHSRQIEVGSKAAVEAKTALSLAAVFGASIDWLVNGVGEPPSERRVRRAVARARAVNVSAA